MDSILTGSSGFHPKNQQLKSSSPFQRTHSIITMDVKSLNKLVSGEKGSSSSNVKIWLEIGGSRKRQGSRHQMKKTIGVI